MMNVRTRKMESMLGSRNLIKGEPVPLKWFTLYSAYDLRVDQRFQGVFKSERIYLIHLLPRVNSYHQVFGLGFG